MAKEKGKKGKKERGKGGDTNDGEKEGIIAESVLPQPIVNEMKEAYLDYAMSVITSRALPDVRDGLKPVHRRILFSMHEMGLTAGARFRKSAAVVGEVLGKYHPHGDSSVYDAMVKMAQEFGFRYPLVLGQGNFGSIDGDAAAAMRYTEAKMSRISGELLRDIQKDTVDFADNYDGTRREPVVLPAAVPGLLLNGTLGIAVGMATNIPPHNLTEVIDATVHLIENSDATTEDLLDYIKGPDFPTGAVIFGEKDIHHAYANGRGSILMRGEAEIVEEKGGKFQIIIRSLPYRVNKADLIVKVADLVKSKKIEDIKDIRDESTTDIRIVIDLKQNSHPNKTLNQLYKYTPIEDKFHMNLVALVDGVPQTLALKDVLEHFIEHRLEVIRRRSEYDLGKAKDREHILLGLKKALDHIDEIIALIKKSKDTEEAHANLVKKFKFSDRQAKAILDMRLQRLAGLERQKIDDELTSIQKLIKELETLLSNKKNMLKAVKDELVEVRDKYGDERKTKVVAHKAKDISLEDMIPNEETVLVFTSGGYVKRTDPSDYKRQHRGGVGVIDLDTKEEDFVTHLITATMHSDVLFFSDKGKVYQIKMYELPEGRRATKGKSIMNFLSLSQDERVTAILPMPKDLKNDDLSVLMVTKHGTGKRVDAASFADVRRGGIIAISLKEGDELISAKFSGKSDQTIVISKKGQAILFKASDIREMGRNAAGVRAIRLKKGDEVIAAHCVPKGSKDAQVLVISENGYGKRTKITGYNIQKRGGGGVKTSKISKKTGDLISAQVVFDEEGEVVAMSKKSQVIRLAVKEVPKLGRSTQGVRIMKLRAGDSIASLICL